MLHAMLWSANFKDVLPL